MAHLIKHLYPFITQSEVLKTLNMRLVQLIVLLLATFTVAAPIAAPLAAPVCTLLLLVAIHR
jgi:hypothetical protein